MRANKNHINSTNGNSRQNSNESESLQSSLSNLRSTSTELSDNKLSVPTADVMKRATVEEEIKSYFYMLTDGCGDENCDNENCVSSGKITPQSPNRAAASALHLQRNRAKLCDRHVSKIPRTKSPTPSQASQSTNNASNAENVTFAYMFLTENVVRGIVNTCQNESRYSQLVATLLDVFSKADTLAKSFLKVECPLRLDNFSPEDLVGLDKEKLRELEGEMEKDIDCSQSSRSFDWTSDEIRIDFFALKKAYENVFELPSHVYESALIKALGIFAENTELELNVELKGKLNNPEEMEKYVIAFLIVFEIPALSSPEFLQKVLPPLCKAMNYLPVSALARICRVWARYCRDSFKNILNLLHQLITMRTIESCSNKKYLLQDNVDIVSATKVMKVLYYANALAGQMESPETTKDEDYDKYESELKNGLFGDIDLRYSYYQSFTFTEDPLAKELKLDLIDCITPFLPFTEFYNEPLSDAIEMDKDYSNYKNALRNEGASSSRSESKSIDQLFSFMTHPFILTPATKTLGLFYDNRIRMYSERKICVLQAMAGHPPNPYLKLKIRRDHLIEDALMRLELSCHESPQDFKKQLMVEFEGEQGMDEGGISKEFFQLIVEEIFNPDYGMFVFDSDTQTCWFNSTSFENESQYKLIGLVLGLAIYNSIILDVRFPMVVYKKLLGKKGIFSDLEDFNPVIYNSLKSLLDHQDDDVEDVYMQTFRISFTDIFGNVVYHDLLPEGDKIPVSLYNKKHFVDLYADFLLNKSISKQFNAFRKGFRMVTDESPMKYLFRPDEIEILICGSKNFDFNELQESTRYDGGYDSSTQIIKNFWEFAHSLSLENQRKLLQFTTGSDRIPVGGLGQLHMIIARNGPDSDRLPTAHTCFNVLLLPEYNTKEKLCDRLMKAINYSKGFGML
ncbi:ubiquitin-protein ligase E3A isoform X2 [Planococcus citri]|uniref:ubiquitin-protein ligase E3A isoform X2 n=1 Tax=Planococcus citri TaxID=170843 RepID=UPI0031F8CFF3